MALRAAFSMTMIITGVANTGGSVASLNRSARCSGCTRRLKEPLAPRGICLMASSKGRDDITFRELRPQTGIDKNSEERRGIEERFLRLAPSRPSLCGIETSNGCDMGLTLS